MVDRKKRPADSRLRAGHYALDDEETTEFSVTPASRGGKVRPPKRPSVSTPRRTESPSRPAPAAKPARRTATRQAAKGDDVLPGGFLLGNRYEILDLVHSGSMSHVYRARDERLPAGDRGNGNVAVKVLRRRLMDRPDTRDMLELEGAKARQLSHPNIINVYDFDEYDGHFCLIMEWLDGQSVKDLLGRTQGKRLDTHFAWHIVDGTARALHHAHSLGFVHADVNPANIFICDTQEIKLLDFGVSRRADEADRDTRRSVWATHPYASPDILDGRLPAVADDIFSLACVAYRLLAGAHPFDDLPPDEARKLGHKPTPIAGLSPADWRLIRSGLSFDSADRPASIAAFERDVAPATPGPSATPVKERPSQSGGQKSRAPLAWGAAAAAVLAAAALAFSFWPDPIAVISGSPATGVPTQPGAGPRRNGDIAASNAGAFESAADDDAALTADATDAAAGPVAAAGNPDDVSRPGPSAPAAEASAGGTSADLDGVTSTEEVAVADGTTTMPATRPAADPAETPAGSFDSTDASLSAATAGDAIPMPADSGQEAAATTAAAATAASASGAAANPDSGAATETRPDDAPPGLPESEATESRVSSAMTDDIVNRQGLAAASGAPASTIEPRSPGRFPGEDAGAATGGAVPVNTQDSGLPRNLAIARAQTDALVSISTSTLPARRESPRPAAPPPRRPESRPPESRPSIGSGQAVAAAPASGAKVDTPPEKERTLKLSDLNIQRYVAPRFPRGARYRDMTGYVDVRFKVLPNGTTGEITVIDSEPGDVFIESAEEAISRWEFARRDDEVSAQVRLSFDLEE